MSTAALTEEEGALEAEQDEYRATRLLLAPEYRDRPVEDIESLLEFALPGLSPEDAENFFRQAARAFSSVGREIVQRAPAILSGAGQGLAAGSAFGPVGAIAGTLGGAALGGVTAGSPGAPQRGTTASAGPRPAPVAAGAAPAATGAARDLAAMLAQPKTGLAVLASLFGPAARRTMPAGGRSVPLGSILAALGTLATRVAEDLAAEGEQDESQLTHLMDAEGGYTVDPADPDARARHVLRVLSEATLEAAEGSGYDEDAENHPGTDEGYDEDLEFDEDFEYDDEAWDEAGYDEVADSEPVGARY